MDLNTHRPAGLSQQLADLSAHFFYLVDYLGGDAAELLFVEDGVYDIAGTRAVGREAIADTFDGRRARGPRTSRHLVLNAHVTAFDGRVAEVTSTMLLFAKDGEPVLPGQAPDAVTDLFDTCELTDDGWRYRERRIRPVFLDPGFVASVPVSLDAS